MSTNSVVVLAVALLLLTAGCTGGGGSAASDADSGSGDGAAEGGSGGSGDEAGSDGAASAGEDAELELTDAEQALRDAGSFTAVWTYYGVDAQGSETEVTREFHADLETERSLTVVSSVQDGQPDSGSMEQFFADGVVYTRSGPAESPTYFSYEQESADVVATAIGLSQARAFGADEDLTFEGRETFDGVTVERYELSRADSQLIQAGSALGTGVAGPDSGDVRITDFQYAVLVDADGLSRFESYTVSGETADGQSVRIEWEYSLTDVGSTTVDDPDWLAEASAQSQG